MRKLDSEFKAGFISEAGTERVNRGYFAHAEMANLACYALADSIDSDEEKESACLAVHALFESLMKKPDFSRAAVKRCLNEAHRTVRTASGAVPLQANVIVVVTDYARMIWAVAGNARLYHFRDKGLHMKSKDQSVAQKMADQGRMAEDDIASHPERHNVFNFVGKQGRFHPFVSREYALQDGDVMVLCNAGFWEQCADAMLTLAARDAADPAALADQCEEILLSRHKHGGARALPQYTVAAIIAKKTCKEPHLVSERMKTQFKKMVPVLVALGIMLAAGLAVKPRITAAANCVLHEKKADGLVRENDFAAAFQEYRAAYNDARTLRRVKLIARTGEKFEVTRMILAADQNCAAGNYDTALEGYAAARSLAPVGGYDLAHIEERLAKTGACMEVARLEEAGDTAAALQDFPRAKSTYSDALAAASTARLTDMMAGLKKKVRAIETQGAVKEQQSKIFEGKKWEHTGDAQCQSKEYTGALQSYVTARRMYEKADMKEQVMTVNEKIQSTTQRAKKKKFVIF